MNISSLQAPCTSSRPARPGLLARLAAMARQPSPRDLDLALLRDIGAPEVLRAQAELREAWHHWMPPDGHFRDL
jgi:hypothetical protein